jgi:hypothetical protein
VQCAWAAVKKKDSYLQAQFYRIKARRGPKKAIMAVVASILTPSISRAGLTILGRATNGLRLAELAENTLACVSSGRRLHDVLHHVPGDLARSRAAP